VDISETIEEELGLKI